MAVDKTKGNANKSKFQKLQEESEALTARLHNLPDYIDKATWPEKSFLENEQTDKGVRLSQVDREIKDLKDTQEPKKTKGFLRDMITDVDGISFHRFQICIWTIILVIVFIIAMYRNLAMPEFSPTLLTLMGISGGTYLGFKFPEIKN